MNGYTDLMLTMGALILFGAYALHVNRSVIGNDTRSQMTKVQNEAVNLAERVIAQASVLPFDEVTADGRLQGNNPAHLTHREDFGLSNGKVRPTDFDDFHEMEWQEAGVFGTYTINCKVQYISMNAQRQPTPYRTLRKRLTVEVSHDALLQPLTLQYIRSYH